MDVTRRQFLIVAASAGLGTMITANAGVAQTGQGMEQPVGDLFMEIFQKDGDTVLAVDLQGIPVMAKVRHRQSRLTRTGIAGIPDTDYIEVPAMQFVSKPHRVTHNIQVTGWEIRFRSEILALGLMSGCKRFMTSRGDHPALDHYATGLLQGDVFQCDRIIMRSEMERVRELIASIERDRKAERGLILSTGD